MPSVATLATCSSNWISEICQSQPGIRLFRLTAFDDHIVLIAHGTGSQHAELQRPSWKSVALSSQPPQNRQGECTGESLAVQCALMR